MPKIVRIIIVVFGAAFVFCIGRCFYMVACISCTSDPIKIYSYNGTVSQFGESLKAFADLNPNISYKFSRRDSSNLKDDGGRDLEVVVKNDTAQFTYGFVCDQEKHQTEVKLVSAFNKKYTMGGYGGKGRGMDKLLNYLDDYFLTPLKKQGTNLITE
ncbi:MAG TPA: hypothetical protein VNW51_00580 [Mucilaginibacter sp.]|jgi:hypothetical protein|nr:hypothetical protein [Mucilaginibacter sp.]